MNVYISSEVTQPKENLFFYRSKSGIKRNVKLMNNAN